MSDIVARGTLCLHCQRYNSRHIVVNCITIFQNKILLIKRGIEPGYGKWALPGGYLDWDESVEEAAAREVLEETGVKVQVLRQLEVRSSPERNSQNVAVVFVAEADSDVLALQKEEILDGGWFDFDKLPDPVAFDHNIMITDYIMQQ